jgi:hypothetical protein
MATKVGTVAAVALVAFLAITGASFAASKHNRCHGEACGSSYPSHTQQGSTFTAPTFAPAESRFYKSRKHIHRKKT